MDLGAVLGGDRIHGSGSPGLWLTKSQQALWKTLRAPLSTPETLKCSNTWRWPQPDYAGAPLRTLFPFRTTPTSCA